MTRINALSQEGAKNRAHFLARRARRALARKERLANEKAAAASSGITLERYRRDCWYECQAIVDRNEENARISREAAARWYAGRYR